MCWAGDPYGACDCRDTIAVWSPDDLPNWTNGTFVYDNSTDCDNLSCNTFPHPWISDGTIAYELDSGVCEIVSTVTCPSDISLKEEIVTIENALSSILQLNPVEFDWNENEPNYYVLNRDGKLHSFGFIAQEVRSVLPELIEIRRNGYYGVDYTSLNSYLVEAIKEQQVFIDDLDSFITNLEKKVGI